MSECKTMMLADAGHGPNRTTYTDVDTTLCRAGTRQRFPADKSAREVYRADGIWCRAVAALSRRGGFKPARWARGVLAALALWLTVATGVQAANLSVDACTGGTVNAFVGDVITITNSWGGDNPPCGSQDITPFDPFGNFNWGTPPDMTITLTAAGSGTVMFGAPVTINSQVAAPTITSFSPSTGSVEGGSFVTITGTNFTGTTSVKFGTTNAASIQVLSDTQISAGIPAHAPGAVKISVTTAAGSVQSSGTYTFVDVTAPVLTAPAAQTASTDVGKATASIDVTSLGSGTDNVDSNVSIIYRVGATVLSGAYDFPVGQTTVTMDAKDAANNAATQVSFTVTVTDSAAPVLVAPDNISAVPDDGKATASIDVTSLGSGTDNVDSNVSIIYRVGATVLSGAYDFPVGQTTVTMDAKDAANNAATQVSFTVTVTDPSAPVLVAPDNISADPDDGKATASIDVTSMGNVTDNVDHNLAITYKVGDTVLTGPFDFPVGTTTVTMDAMDSAQNKAVQASFTVSVAEPTPPPAPDITEVMVHNDRRLTVLGRAELGSTVTVTFPDGSSVRVPVAGPADNAAQVAGVSAMQAVSTPSTTPAPLEARSTSPKTGTFSATSQGPQSSGKVWATATGSNGAVSAAAQAVADTRAPKVVLSGAPESITGQQVFSVMVSFDEPVTGLEPSDFSVTGAEVLAVNGSQAEYSAQLRATGKGDVTLSLPAGSARDAAGNLTEASNTLVIANRTVEETQKVIAKFLYARTNQLIVNQPVLSDLLRGTTQNTIDLQVTQGAATGDLSYYGQNGIWAEVKGSWSEYDGQDSSYALGAFGAHRAFGPDLIVGALVELDHMSSQDGDAKVDGNGWMAGPYIVTRLSEQRLYFEGKLLWGQSSNTVSPFGTYEDDFDTERLLAQVRMTGDMAFGKTTLSPFADIAYAEDRQKSYADSLGNMIPNQNAELTQAALGFDVLHTVMLNQAAVDLKAGISGIWSEVGGTAVAKSVIPSSQGWRGKTTLGLDYRTSNRGTVTASAFYDGLGQSYYESFGLDLGYNLSF